MKRSLKCGRLVLPQELRQLRDIFAAIRRASSSLSRDRVGVGESCSSVQIRSVAVMSSVRLTTTARSRPANTRCKGEGVQ
jgi:hypothetical protein